MLTPTAAPLSSQPVFSIMTDTSLLSLKVQEKKQLWCHWLTLPTPSNTVQTYTSNPSVAAEGEKVWYFTPTSMPVCPFRSTPMLPITILQ